MILLYLIDPTTGIGRTPPKVDKTSCAATLNKTMQHLDFRTHMFRYAFIDRLKACGDVPVPITEPITGHGRNASEFARYGSVGYTPEQSGLLCPDGRSHPHPCPEL
jgi:hypothetical protein